ncbi:hypothetical protein F4604DRAFT_855090 [Suillus subluteus]|nr:hypothetical protein F4604DRAFT_855090 [Suillus subluteus]
MKLVQIIYLTILAAASAAASATRVRAVASPQESWACYGNPDIACTSHPISNCPTGLVSYRVTWTCWSCCYSVT